MNNLSSPRHRLTAWGVDSTGSSTAAVVVSMAPHL